MESLQDILGSKKFAAPDEMERLKGYIKRKYKAKSSVKLQNGAFIVSVPSSALAGTLQLEKPAIIQACDLGDKKLVIRIS